MVDVVSVSQYEGAYLRQLKKVRIVLDESFRYSVVRVNSENVSYRDMRLIGSGDTNSLC